jgi:hypothetical protein
VHLLRYVVKCTVTDSFFHHSIKLFEVSSICLDTFSDSCDQRTCKLRKHCGAVDASCRAEKWLKELLLGYKPVQHVTVLNI